jgi:hypothetical protein
MYKSVHEYLIEGTYIKCMYIFMYPTASQHLLGVIATIISVYMNMGIAHLSYLDALMFSYSSRRSIPSCLITV